MSDETDLAPEPADASAIEPPPDASVPPQDGPTTVEPPVPEPPPEPPASELRLEPSAPGPPAGPPPVVPAAPPRPVWPRVGAVLSGSFDLVTAARIPLRNASLYIGLLGLATMGPAVLAFLSQLDALRRPGLEGISGWAILALVPASLGIIAVAIEGQIVGIAILAGARVGRPLGLREALRRSRAVFWRVVRASILVGMISGLLSQFVAGALGGVFGTGSDAAPVGASLLAGVLTAPLAYVDAGIVLGDVGALESISRSIRLSRARLRLAVLVSVFAVITQYILLFAALSGLDLAVRALEPFRGQLAGIQPGTLTGFVLIGGGSLIALLAYWTLTFTVGALASAPQVVAFLGLTGYSRGLDAAREAAEGEPPRPKPAIVSTPMTIGIVVAGASALLAIAAGAR